ncbi:MAG: hypothetical protein VCD66_00275 [Alphaproteobacteria bacterium]
MCIWVAEACPARRRIFRDAEFAQRIHGVADVALIVMPRRLAGNEEGEFGYVRMDRIKHRFCVISPAKAENRYRAAHKSPRMRMQAVHRGARPFAPFPWRTAIVPSSSALISRE